MPPRHSWSLDWLDMFSRLLFDPYFMGMLLHGLEQGGGEGDWEIERRPNEEPEGWSARNLKGWEALRVCDRRLGLGAVIATVQVTTTNEWSYYKYFLFVKMLSIWLRRFVDPVDGCDLPWPDCDEHLCHTVVLLFWIELANHQVHQRRK